MRTPSRRLAAALACAALLGACAQRQAAPSEEAGDPREVELGAVEPSPLPLTAPAPSAAGEDAGDPSDDSTADGGAPVGSDGTGDDGTPVGTDPAPTPPASSGSPTESRPEPVTLLAVGDRSDDHGARGPDWADLITIEMVSTGADFTVTARFAAPLPTTVPENEVMLVSIDVGERNDDGNAYQLFVTGNNAGGWLAYFYGPEDDEARPFPADGVFTIAGSTMTVGVPWNQVGSPTRGPLEVLAEWSRDEGGILGALNPASEDKLDGQPHTFDRNP